VIEAIKPIVGQAKPSSPRDEKLREPSSPGHSAPAPEASDELRMKILKLLSHTPVSVDELARLANTPAGVVQIILLELELAGRLERYGGGLVSLR
jgi:DNA processing protein